MDSQPPAEHLENQAHPSRPQQLRIELGGAGWVLLAAGLIGIYLLLKLTWPLLSGTIKPQPLNPQTAEELGFDLSNCRVPREQIIVAAPAHSIPPLNRPATQRGAAAAQITKEFRRRYHHKFVVPGDRVIGVTLNGESRAYQLKIMQWHEVANDVLGGVPIAVTYSPLTDSVVVYDRRVGKAVVMLAASGLLYNSNSLLYDNPEPLTEWTVQGASLWTQISGIAESGASTGAALPRLPCELTHWGNWLARYPDTTLLSHDTGYDRKYTINAYGAYFDRMKLRFPVDRAPTAPSTQFTRMIAVQRPDGRWAAFDYLTLKDQPVQGELRFVYEPFAAGLEPDTVRLESPLRNLAGQELPVVYGLRFALEAFGYLDH